MAFVQRRRGHSILAGAAALLFASGFAFCQSAPPRPPDAQSGGQTAPVLRFSVRLIQVNVIAEDRDGNPVHDLKKEDFTLLDQGERQQISLFSLENSIAPPSSSPDVSLAASANFFSNHVQSGPSGANSVTVILIDTVNTAFKDLPYVRSQVIAFLQKLQPQDQVALYLLTPAKLYTLHDFTNDSQTLLRLLGEKNKATAAPGGPRTPALDAGDVRARKLLSDAFVEANRFYQGGRGVIEATNLGLRQIASNVVNIPGRKNLIWISGGFPVAMSFDSASKTRADYPDFNATLSITAKILGDADVAVYPVDARGLVAPTGGDGAIISTSDSMLSIASGTGGHAFYNTNDITGSIRKAIDDSRVSYLLGYYPTNETWNGSFRAITLRVSRPGVHLRYRTGYYSDLQTAENELAHSRLIKDAIRSPLQLINLGLEVQAEPVTSGSGREMKVDVRVAGNQMRFEKHGDRWRDIVDVVWVGMSSDGRVLDSDGDIVGLRPGQNGYDEIQQKGFSFTEHVHLGNQAVEMRLVVRDRGSGAIGSVNIPLTRLYSGIGAERPKDK